MANGHGGYRQPSNPASVSGPGALSRRTDGGPIRDLPNAEYGGNAEFRALQQAAPVSASGADSDMGSSEPASQPAGFDADTAYPDMPVTAGADAGAGPGMEALGLPDTSNEVEDLRRRYGALLPFLIRKADHPSSSQEFRDQVRYLVARIG